MYFQVNQDVASSLCVYFLSLVDFVLFWSQGAFLTSNILRLQKYGQVCVWLARKGKFLNSSNLIIFQQKVWPVGDLRVIFQIVVFNGYPGKIPLLHYDSVLLPGGKRMLVDLQNSLMVYLEVRCNCSLTSRDFLYGYNYLNDCPVGL